MTATINVGNTPYGVAVNPTTGVIYVANNISGTVSVINPATNTVTATLTVGSDPVGVAVSPTSGYAYVANQLGNTISVISGG